MDAKMNGTDEHPSDPLLSGFYSLSDASRLVGAAPGVVRGWLNGYANSSAGPVIDRDFEGTHTVSFLDLMELRFIAMFRGQGLSMPTIRKAAAQARRDWNVRHPLAMSSEHYVTDRRNVFAQAAEESGDSITWDLATGQHEMWATIERTIERGIVFDPKTYIAKFWRPKEAEFPKVIIDPRIAFGRPSLEGFRVPTSAVFNQWKAEANIERVAMWLGLPANLVEMAIEYELTAA